MKKTLTLILCLVMILSMLAACAGKTDNTPASDTAPEDKAADKTDDKADGKEEGPAEEDKTDDSSHPSGESSGEGKVATPDDMTDVIDVVEEGMVPVYADSIKDGTYAVQVDASSSMFKILSCDLTVADGKMTAVLHMGSGAYTYMYMGSAEEAAAAAQSDCIALEENGDDNTFTLPVEALDSGIECAAFSKRKELWYPRTLLFRADSIPMDAYADGVIATAESLGLQDGEYTVEVALAGGSGRASVESPAKMVVSGGVCTATIIWSSPNYDYMKVNDEKYLPVNTDGNSVFEIPVAAFDYKMPVIADTTAMSQPYEIEYTLCFDSASITPAQ